MFSDMIWWSNCAAHSRNTIAEWKYASRNIALHILCYPDYSLWKHKLLLWGIKLCLLQNRDKSSTCISDKPSNHWFRITHFFYIQNSVKRVAIIITLFLYWACCISAMWPTKKKKEIIKPSLSAFLLKCNYQSNWIWLLKKPS